MKLQVLISSSEKLNSQFQNFKNVIEKTRIKLASTNKLAQNEPISICSPSLLKTNLILYVHHVIAHMSWNL
jgi:hypothetical protein